MKRETKELIAGFFLALALGGVLLSLHLKSALPQKNKGFVLHAYFYNADGVLKGTDVRLAGLKVGEVTGEEMADGWRVKLSLSFDKDPKLPFDSSAVIETDGLLGPKHIELFPGGDEEFLANGDELAYTQDSLILNELLEKVNRHMEQKKKNASEASQKTQEGMNDEKKSD